VIDDLEYHLLAAIHRELDGKGVTGLSQVLRRGLEYASLYLTTDTQIADLAGAVPSRNVKGEMRNWRFISFQLDHQEARRLQILLLGERGPNSIVTTTSPVKRIDFAEGLVCTMNSVYRLRMEARGVGEPSAKQLICLCRTLHSWGVGSAFGVPHI
jgi:hypothetical protein